MLLLVSCCRRCPLPGVCCRHVLLQPSVRAVPVRHDKPHRSLFTQRLLLPVRVSGSSKHVTAVGILTASDWHLLVFPGTGFYTQLSAVDAGIHVSFLCAACSYGIINGDTSTCVICQTGTYSATNFTRQPCTSCGTGYTTPSAGAPSASYCVCAAGWGKWPLLIAFYCQYCTSNHGCTHGMDPRHRLTERHHLFQCAAAHCFLSCASM